ncbi:MAG TPA: signal recognition particle-docking protein FtsY [Candidatus Humimicrobiaceae bacterium]
MQRLIKNLSLIWNRFKKSNEDFWLEIEEQLILNDIGVKTAAFIIEEVKNHCRKENINDLEQIKMLLKKYILEILNGGAAASAAEAAVLPDYNLSNSIPSVWMLVGVNGVGKTSTVAKLASFFQNEGKNVLLAAADTFRAAAYEQLDHFAEQLGLPIVHHQRGSDPGAVVYDSIEKAVARKIDIVLIDTAGRMHTAYNLMEELKKIKKVINKKTGRNPDEILMVIDATTGQNAKHQAAIFNEAVGLSGIILTKTDGTSKGGIVLTVKNELKIPVKFLTFGEKIENLEVFNAEKFTDLLFS